MSENYAFIGSYTDTFLSLLPVTLIPAQASEQWATLWPPTSAKKFLRQQHST
jgi:hypothetical protein